MRICAVVQYSFCSEHLSNINNSFNIFVENEMTYYSGIPISRTSRGNTNWFEKSGVREIEGGLKLC